MPYIDPGLVRIGLVIVIIALVFLAFTHLVEFLKPILIAVALLVLAYILYQYLNTGVIGL